jgi:hypothetical protein
MYNAGTLKLTSIALPTTLTLTGESKYLTTIKRTANANTVSIIAADSSEISNISINNDKATNGFDGHGIAGTQPKTTIKDVSISDFGSTSGGGGAGVCLFHSATNPKLMRLSNSEMSGSSSATQSYGWLMEGCDTSFVNNVYTVSIKNYGHELKNQTTYSMLSNLISENSSTALGYGQDTGTGPSYNVAVGIVSKANDVGFVTGYSNYNLTSTLLHNNTGAPAISGTSHLARFESTSSYNALFGAMGVGSFVNTVRYDGTSNYAQIISHDTTSTVVQLQSGAAKNATEIAHPGARTSIRSTITDLSGNAIRGSNANPTWCHATGERVGSISGKFWDKLGASGASPNTNHHWVSESDQYAIHSYATPGNNGDSIGIAYATPSSSSQGSILYNKSATNGNDYWSVVVGNTASYRFFNSVFRPESDGTIALGGASNRWSTVYSTNTKYTPVTVATLPSAVTLGAGARAFVSNATATTFASIVAGGGANNVPVYSDGTNWRIG